jgi:chemotaxis signal transduction protein
VAENRIRYLVCGFGLETYAIPFDAVAYVLKSPEGVKPWLGSSLLSGFFCHQGRVVWVTRFSEIFIAKTQSESKGSWVVVLKRPDVGITQVGFFAEIVRGPVSESRLGNIQRVDQASESLFCDS